MQKFIHVHKVHVFPVYIECETNRCENGGSCAKLGVSYTCACTDGYSGSLCEAFSKQNVSMYLY